MHSTTLAPAAERGHGAENVRAAVAIACLAAMGCRKVDPGPDLQIVGEGTRVRLEDPHPAQTPWLVDGTVQLVAARGETLGLQVLHRLPGPTTLTFTDGNVAIAAYDVESFPVTRASTAMYGGGRTGTFADGLRPASSSSTNPAYVEVRVPPALAPGAYAGQLTVGDRRLPVTLTVLAVTLPVGLARVWAYEDPRELAWAIGATPVPGALTDQERACARVFAARGVGFMPDLHLEWWDQRKHDLPNLRDLPVVIPTDPAAAAVAVKAWIAATTGTPYLPFSIPIDEPGTPEKRAKVIELAKAVRAAGGGPNTFRFAVTADPRPEYGDLIDLYISLHAPRSGTSDHWTYNGTPPAAGSMVLDAATPGTRTWGWIAYRWNIPVWYVWDAIYWHDRHNRHGAPLPGKQLVPTTDPTSFDSDDDHGNFDGVLALPDPDGCRSTLRLEALRRGQEDRALLDVAAACDRTATDGVVAKLVPTALGDAPRTGDPSWPTDEGAWELARREVLRIAATCARR